MVPSQGLGTSCDIPHVICGAGVAVVQQGATRTTCGMGSPSPAQNRARCRTSTSAVNGWPRGAHSAGMAPEASLGPKHPLARSIPWSGASLGPRLPLVSPSPNCAEKATVVLAAQTRAT